MKKILTVLSAVLILICSAAGQENAGKYVLLSDGSQVNAKNLSAWETDKNDLEQMHVYAEDRVVILFFSKIPTALQRQEHEGSGLFIGDYMTNEAFICRFPSAWKAAQLQEKGVVGFATLPKSVRWPEESLTKYDPSQGAIVSFIPGLQPNATILELAAKKGIILEQINGTPFAIFHQEREQISTLSSLEFVWSFSHLEKEVPNGPSENVNYSRVNTIHSTGFSGAEKLSGKGIKTLVVDGGLISPHIDLNKRVINLTNKQHVSYNDHQELVSGILGGQGNLDPQWQGAAFNATIYTRQSGDLLEFGARDFDSVGITITNNSYGPVSNNKGRYLTNSATLDRIINDRPHYFHFFSAGNQGQLTSGSFAKGFNKVNDGLGISKNGITMGNVTIFDSIAPSSSKGPTFDGRVKPDFVANGSQIQSLTHDNEHKYRPDGGTSSASPTAAGITTLLSEYYKNRHGKNPRVDLIKAVYAASAEDLGVAGPDFTYGFGRIHAKGALEVLKKSTHKLDSFTSTGSKTFQITVPSGLSQLSVALAWVDKEGGFISIQSLINDLDLEVIAPNSTVYKPWVLDASASQVEVAASRKRDSLNNIELFNIPTPSTGTWTVKVTAKRLISSKQIYACGWDFREAKLELTYPYGAEKLIPGDQVYIRWDDDTGSSSNFALEYSDDNGSNWTTINSNVSNSLRAYLWTIPSVLSPSCLVRVKHTVGSAQSSSKAVFTIAARPDGLQVVAVCQDYGLLKWNTIPMFPNFTIWGLDSSMKAVDFSIDTFMYVSLKRELDQNWFGVSANVMGIESTRSKAVYLHAKNGGTCPFTNDLALDSILYIGNGRTDFPSQKTNAETIRVKISNRTNASISGFVVRYQINGGAVINETHAGALAADDSIYYSFQTKANFSATGKYKIRAWVSYANDFHNHNDTAEIEFRQWPNPAVSLPYQFDFSANYSNWLNTDSIIGLEGYSNVDYIGLGKGQLRFAWSGEGVYLESQTKGDLGTNKLILNLNLDAYKNKTIGFSFDWTAFNEFKNNGDGLYIRGAAHLPWVFCYDTYTAFKSSQDVKKRSDFLSISDLLHEAGQQVSKTTQIRFGQEGTGISEITAFPIFGTGGVLLNAIEIKESGADLSLDSFVSLKYHNDGYGNNTTVRVKMRNRYHQTLSQVNMHYQVDGGSVQSAQIHSLSGQQTSYYDFANTYDFTQNKWYEITAWLSQAQDTFLQNDTIHLRFFNSKKLATYPVSHDYESSKEAWWTDGKKSSWAQGNPTASNISQSGSNAKCWATNLAGNHTSLELSYLNSPVYQTDAWNGEAMILSGYIKAVSKKMHLEYAVDGESFIKLGQYGEGVNWYNDSIRQVWNLHFGGWKKCVYRIPNAVFNTSDKIKFRFVFDASGSNLTQEGFAVDLVEIYKEGQDFELVEVIAPITSCGLSSTSTLVVKVANHSSTAGSTVPISFSLNGGSTVTESISSIPAGDTVSFTFSQKIDLSTFIAHELDIWVASSTDNNPINDSLLNYTVTSKPEITSLPYSESFENGVSGWHSHGIKSSWALGTPANANYPASAAQGSKAWCTNLSGNYNIGEFSYLESPCFDFSQQTLNPFISFHHSYSLGSDVRLWLEYSEDGETWVKLGQQGSSSSWYNQADYWSGFIYGWHKAKIEFPLAALADSTSVRIRFVFKNVNSNTRYGYGLDSFSVFVVANDLAFEEMVEPTHGCGLSSSQQIKVAITNNSTSGQQNFQIKYNVNGGSTKSQTISTVLAAGVTDTFTLSNTHDFSTAGKYELDFWLDHSADNFPANDSLLDQIIISSSVLNSFPYAEGFEASGGGWLSPGGLWQHGTPSSTHIQSAASGSKAWMTNLTGFYNVNDTQYLYSPCFDFSSFSSDPQLSYYIKYKTGDFNDILYLQYSDDSKTWHNINSGHRGTINVWGQSSYSLDLSNLSQVSQVKLRFAFISNSQSVNDGFAIDDFEIDGAGQDVGLATIDYPTVSCDMNGTVYPKVKVFNLTHQTITNLSIAYTVNGGAETVEQLASLAGTDTAIFTFSTPIAPSPGQEYKFVFYSKNAQDIDHSNDTIKRNLVGGSSAGAIPSQLSFESSADGFWATGTNSSWEHGVPSDTRISQAYQGNKAWVTNLNGNYSQGEASFLNSPCYDLSSASGSVWVRFGLFRYLGTGASVTLWYSENDGQSWTKLGSTGSGTNWYNSASTWAGFNSSWMQATHEVPVSSMSDDSKVRFRFEMTSSPSFSPNEGFAMDQFEVYEIQNDIEMLQLISPTANENTGNLQVKVRIRNNSNSTQANIPVNYSWNGQAAQSQSIASLAASASVDMTFTTPISANQIGQFSFKSWTSLSGDTYPWNDSLERQVTVQNVVTSYPYYTSLETGDGSWISSGVANSWAYGKPSASQITSANSGQKAWVTNLTGNAGVNELSYLESPLFDMRSLTSNPTFSFVANRKMSNIHQCWVEYSEDGSTWTKLGQQGSGQNWYNSSSHYWQGSNQGWEEASYEVPLQLVSDSSGLRFRWVFDTDQWNPAEGIAIDDIFIGDKGQDITLQAVTAPDTSCGLSSAETVTISIKNNNSSATGSFQAFYQLDNQPAVSQSISGINASSIISLDFTQKLNASQARSYTLKTWVKAGFDAYHFNDTFTYHFSHDPTINSFPYVQSFESDNGSWYGAGVGSDHSWEYGTPSGSLLSSAASGSKSWITNADGAVTLGEKSYLYSPCFDLSNFTANPTVSFKIAFDLAWGVNAWLEYSEDGTTWQKLGLNGSGQNWYNSSNHYWYQDQTTWALASYTLPVLSMTSSSSVKFRFVYKGDNWTTVEGLAIDDFSLQEISNDVAPLAVLNQTKGAGWGMETISVKVKNNSASPQNNVFVYYKLDQGVAVKDTISSIAAGQSVDFSFSQKVDLSAFKSYALSVWTDHAADNYGSNDRLGEVTLTNQKYIDTYPYFEGFETDNGTFISEGSLSSWAYGSPNNSNSVISEAAGGTKVWATNLNGKFTNGEISFLYSPIFDLSGQSQNLVLSMGMIYYQEFDSEFSIQYSEDGQTWTNLSASADSRNWSGFGFTFNRDYWHVASTEIPITSMSSKDSVRFRVSFNAQFAFTGYEGVAIDNFHIHEKGKIYSGSTVKNITASTSGNSWVHFDKNNDRLVSINPMGQNLGTVDVTSYVHQGSVRDYADQYLLNRSWVINPTNAPTTAVKLRLFMLDAEVQALRQASGCSNCSDIKDAFKLGVTKYHGSNEDSLLSNNLAGSYTWYGGSSLEIVPFANGYYLEFEVSDFSEFFINNGGSTGNAPLPVELIYFEGKQKDDDVLLNWETATELNNDFFEIQRSLDGVHFQTIDTVKGNGTQLNISTYQYLDQDISLQRIDQPVLYYRLRQSDFDGTRSYSAVEEVYYDKQAHSSSIELLFDRYTNVLTVKSEDRSKLSWKLVNTLGQFLQSGELRGANNQVDVSAYPSGHYIIYLYQPGFVQSIKFSKP